MALHTNNLVLSAFLPRSRYFRLKLLPLTGPTSLRKPLEWRKTAATHFPQKEYVNRYAKHLFGRVSHFAYGINNPHKGKLSESGWSYSSNPGTNFFWLGHVAATVAMMIR